MSGQYGRTGALLAERTRGVAPCGENYAWVNSLRDQYIFWVQRFILRDYNDSGYRYFSCGVLDSIDHEVAVLNDSEDARPHRRILGVDERRGRPVFRPRLSVSADLCTARTKNSTNGWRMIAILILSCTNPARTVITSEQ